MNEDTVTVINELKFLRKGLKELAMAVLELSQITMCEIDTLKHEVKDSEQHMDDGGPVLCPNCGARMYWHVEHEGYTAIKFFSCEGTFSCHLDTISFTPTTDEAEAAAIVRKMRRHKGEQ